MNTIRKLILALLYFSTLLKLASSLRICIIGAGNVRLYRIQKKTFKIKFLRLIKVRVAF